MILAGIDIANDKHDCYIMNYEVEVLADVFPITNNAKDFDTLLQTIKPHSNSTGKIREELEATG